MNRSDILKKATECVCGQREQDYGKPEDNFQTIADLWGAYKDVEFTAKDVAIMMALMNIASIKTGTGTADCFVDPAGVENMLLAIATSVNTYKVEFNSSRKMNDTVIELNRCISKHGSVSVAYLYQYLDIPSTAKEQEIGWMTELFCSFTNDDSGNFTLHLPLPVKIPAPITIEKSEADTDDVGTDGY